MESVTSTMDEARKLSGAASGTVIAAGIQTAARGRSGRPWKENKEESLSFTVILRYKDFKSIPSCFTIRAGIAVSLAIEDFTASLLVKNVGIDGAAAFNGRPFSPLSKISHRAGGASNMAKLKWPNDVMLLDKENHGRKAAGILTEAEGGTVYLGIGVNVAQKSFPPDIFRKACSIAQFVSQVFDYDETIYLTAAKQRFTLLEFVLFRLYEELQNAGSLEMQKFLKERLYMKGQRVCFIPGVPEELSAASRVNPEKIEGILQGVNKEGEMLITLDSGETLSFITGELKVY